METKNVNFCELCQEWVEEPTMVCEYRGQNGTLTITNEGWPDRTEGHNPHSLRNRLYEQEKEIKRLQALLDSDILKK